MSAVSALAIVFAVLGWLVVALVAILGLTGGIISAQALRSPQAGLMVMAALAPFCISSLGLFLAWGILRGLCEIHSQRQLTLQATAALSSSKTNAPRAGGPHPETSPASDNETIPRLAGAPGETRNVLVSDVEEYLRSGWEVVSRKGTIALIRRP